MDYKLMLIINFQVNKVYYGDCSLIMSKINHSYPNTHSNLNVSFLSISKIQDHQYFMKSKYKANLNGHFLNNLYHSNIHGILIHSLISNYLNSLIIFLIISKSFKIILMIKYKISMLYIFLII